MQPLIKLVPRAAIFLAGIAAGAFTVSRREGAGMDAAALDALKKSLAGLEKKISEQDAAQSGRLGRIESRLDEHGARLDEHAARLSEMPSTGQIVAAMEQLLQKTMGSLDERLAAQARSIEVLKTTVSQTDNLLERVLESLDSLQPYTEPVEAAASAAVVRPA
jgi:chromosome segregation ATPase